MNLSYNKLSEKPRIFKKLTGVSICEFTIILDLISNDFDSAFPNIGRRPKIKTHQDRLVLILLYYRCYVTHEFIGYFVSAKPSTPKLNFLGFVVLYTKA